MQLTPDKKNRISNADALKQLTTKVTTNSALVRTECSQILKAKWDCFAIATFFVRHFFFIANEIRI